MDEDKNMTYNNYLFAKYYIFAALFQTIWSIAVLGFTTFLVLHFNNYWVLFCLGLILATPYKTLTHSLSKSDDEDKDKSRKRYGTNNPS